MAELEAAEVPVNVVVIPTTLPSTSTNNNVINNNDDDNNNNIITTAPNLAPKRQRRPSVRLGEIGGGDQPPPPTAAAAAATLPYDSPFPRRPKSWRFHRDPTALAASKSSSKIRPLTNLVNGHAADSPEFENNTDNFGSRKPKLRKTVKRVRTNWTSAASKNGVEMDSNNYNTFSNKDEDGEEFRVVETDASDSPLREQSPVHSVDNAAELNFWNRSRPNHNHKAESNRIHSGLDDGVRDWLMGLGLSRYGPLFEIHEVDDQVLPMLTLEDLKDMGINAVGSRRKMFASIVKLSKGFS